jgi:hypothetical protein
MHDMNATAKPAATGAPAGGDPAIAAAILRLVQARGAGKSICPTDAARAVAPEAWRTRLADVRRVAVALARDGRIDILRKGRVIDPAALHGVIRLRLHAPPDETEKAAQAGDAGEA